MSTAQAEGFTVSKAPAPGLIDTHCHLADPVFARDCDAVIDRAAAACVVALVTVGYDLPTSRQSIDLARRHAGVHAAVGIHPNESRSYSAVADDELAALAAMPEAVAIGETGLDYYRDRADRPTQRRAFEAHLRLASALGKPVVIHDREAHADVLGVLVDWAADQRRIGRQGPLGVLHCFSGDSELAATVCELGFLVSFAGNVTFPAAGALRQCAAAVDLACLLVETDSPFLSPVPHRGRRSEPGYVTEVARVVAAARGLSAGALAQITTANARRLFALTPDDAQPLPTLAPAVSRA